LDGHLKKCQSPRILHIATHGFFLEDATRDPYESRSAFDAMSVSESGMDRFGGSRVENPLLRSGLVLAGFNTWLKQGELMEDAEDGLLTAEDAAGLDLLDTELVVLSACETGLGDVSVGEGVFGLRRAFVLAGARTLVMSLWKVPDEQTQELMEDFYHRMLGTDGKPPQPRAEALRDAQLAVKARHPQPFYWGAFICQGYDGVLVR
jgi:CHAT domain-containing protein